MATEIIQAYDVFEPLDTVEGKGGVKHIGRFYDRAVAVAVGKGKDVWGGNIEPREIDCVVIGEIAYEITSPRPIYRTHRDSVIDQLTCEQRKIIGI
ncbi:MAG: hypothetical protein P4L53_09105 [Candidatus Obscuribacterales bacterium]|nr:hypothetical protein [Candidatus Obscuribacterales bacterium]